MAEQSKKRRGKAQLIPSACIGCGKCQSVCPVDAITYDDKGEPVIDHDKCIGCGKCVKVCPVAALRMSYPEGGDTVVESTPPGEEDEEPLQEQRPMNGEGCGFLSSTEKAGLTPYRGSSLARAFSWPPIWARNFPP